MEHEPTKNKISSAFRYAFPKTTPILFGFLFLGLSYGIYMYSMGFSWGYTLALSALIYAGSMEFVTVAMLLSPFDPVSAFLITLMVNGRHIFYGLSMLEVYRNTGWLKPYLIFGMCDESFSINYTSQIPLGVSKGWIYFFVTLLNQLYWVVGSIIGNLFASVISFDGKGLEFVLTALFIVLAIEQYKIQRNLISSSIGLVIPGIALWIFGSEHFMIPAMLGIVVILSLLRNTMEG
ncbi:AzlC family ABC transporter permease [Veillonella sp. 3960]|uniref:AzlC family ABC transporter permease n=1 Tax=Veillonella sp. 3960 TaxID=2490955 RepID=UPI000F8DE5AE|nr:AzlC family ABC transporter permease [Veillonella sp. 3960]